MRLVPRALPVALALTAALCPAALAATPSPGGAQAPAATKAPAGAKPPAARTRPPLLGIADQKSDFLLDPRFQSMGVRKVRIAVAWDAMRSDWQIRELDRWMALARAAGVEVLVTWSPSRLAGQRTNWPSVAAFTEQFALFRARYPWITRFSTWNEANFNGFGPWDRPELAAQWYVALVAACPSCTILGADLHDSPSMVRWTKRFLRAAGRQPVAWGLHNYVSVNRLQTGPVVDLLAAVKGRVWLTETGGLVARRSKSLIKLPEGRAHAARVTRFLLTTVAALPRVDRIYFYQWNSSTPTDSWDSSFVGFDGTPRPALAELTRRLPVRRTPLPALTAAHVPALVEALERAAPPTPALTPPPAAAEPAPAEPAPAPAG